MDPEGRGEDGECHQRDCDDQRNDRQMMGVHRGDHDETHDVVDDRERKDEAAQSFGSMPAEKSQQAKGEGSISRHRHAPAVRRGPTGVDRQVEPNRARHPAESREHRKDDPGTLSELADVEFPACLEPDDQEEEAHEPAVDPSAQIHGDRRAHRAVRSGGSAIRGRRRTRRCSPRSGLRLRPPGGGPARRLGLQESAKGSVALQPRRQAGALGRFDHGHTAGGEPI